MEERYILSIDPALSTTGYSVIRLSDGKLLLAEKFVTKKKDGSDEDRNYLIISKLIECAKKFNISYVVFEDGFSKSNMKTGLQLAFLRGGIANVFRRLGIYTHRSLPSEIRLHLGCVGDASKEDVANAVTELYKNDDVFRTIGPYSDKQNKDKTSDIYDAISIGVSFRNRVIKGELSL